MGREHPQRSVYQSPGCYTHTNTTVAQSSSEWTNTAQTVEYAQALFWPQTTSAAETVKRVTSWWFFAFLCLFPVTLCSIITFFTSKFPIPIIQVCLSLGSFHLATEEDDVSPPAPLISKDEDENIVYSDRHLVPHMLPRRWDSIKVNLKLFRVTQISHRHSLERRLSM